MSGLNITEYHTDPSDYYMYYGKISLKEGYYLANFSERAYHLIFTGGKGYLSIPELIHPEDVDVFYAALEKLDEEPQHLVLRMQCFGGEYRYFYMIVSYNGRMMGDFRSIDLELTEIMAITDKFKDYSSDIKKYREYMSLYKGNFLEYECSTDILYLHRYENRQSNRIYKGTLEETAERIERDPSYTVSQKAEFQTLYAALKGGRDHMKLEVDAELFRKGDEGRYEINLKTIFGESARERSVALITVIGRREEKECYYMSSNAYDPGTGLLNKRAINEYAIDKIQAGTKGLYLAVMDVDDFKKVNDNFGHMFGDEVLSKVADILQSVISVRGMVGRFGGDEFMVVFEGIDSEATLRRILSTVNRNIEWAFGNVEGLKVTTSTGIAKYPEDGTTYEELFKKADKCVYIAKAKGKNRYIIYNEEKHGKVENEEATRINVGLHATISDEKKNEAVSDMILSLYRDGEKALISVMEQLQAYFDIDGIAIYGDEGMKRLYSVGKYINPIEALPGVQSEVYLSFFDERGVCTKNRIQSFENKVPEVFKLYQNQETGKIAQCAAVRNGRIEALVSYDFFNRYPKLSDTDEGLIKIAGRIMAEIVADRQKKAQGRKA